MSPSSIGQRLQEAIDRSGKGIGQVAREAPIDRSHLKRIIKGSVGIGRRKAEDLARTLNVSAGWLLGLEPTEKPAPLPQEDPAIRQFGLWMSGLDPAIRVKVHEIGEALKLLYRRRKPDGSLPLPGGTVENKWTPARSAGSTRSVRAKGRKHRS